MSRNNGLWLLEKSLIQNKKEGLPYGSKKALGVANSLELMGFFTDAHKCDSVSGSIETLSAPAKLVTHRRRQFT